MARHSVICAELASSATSYDVPVKILWLDVAASPELCTRIKMNKNAQLRHARLRIPYSSYLTTFNYCSH